MAEVDFISKLHKSTTRNYLARVNDQIYPKPKAAELAKKFNYDYWDGDRRICYGGYNYIPGRWEKVAEKMNEYYNLPQHSKILDIGCGGGLISEPLSRLGAEVTGIDASEKNIKIASLHAKKNNLKIRYLNLSPEKFTRWPRKPIEEEIHLILIKQLLIIFEKKNYLNFLVMRLYGIM